MSPAKKTSKKKEAVAVPALDEVTASAEYVDEPDPPVTLVPCPDDFMPFNRQKTTPEDLSALLGSVYAFELAHNANELRDYVAKLSAVDFYELYLWAREIEWSLCGRPTGENAVAAARLSFLAPPTFFLPKVAQDLKTREIARETLDHVIEDVVEEATAAETESNTLSEAEDEAVLDDDEDDTDDDDLWDADEEAGDDDEVGAGPASAPAAEPDGQLTLVQEPTPPKKPLTPLTFQSGEQVASVRLALKARADDLRGEAKRLSGLGRTVEAAALEREARDISEQLLRQVESQAAIPFNESETLPQAIKRVVQGEVRYRARAALLKSVVQKKGETKQDAEQRALGKLDDLEQLIGNIGEQAGLLVCDILVEAADRAKEAGKVERQATASQLAREAVQAVEGRKHAERDAA